MNVLLVGDDLAKKAAIALESAKITATVVPTLEEAEEMATLYIFDAMLLAQTNPALESNVRKIRRAGLKLPILVLSGVSVGDVKAAVLEAGADDYVVDPFHAGELVARVHAMARRSTGHASSEITVGDLTITLGQSGIVLVKGKTVKLRPKVFRMLEMFMRRPGVVFTRQQILDHVWMDVHIDERTIDVHMGRLRKLLKEQSGGTDYFETISGVGYVLTAPAKI